MQHIVKKSLIAATLAFSFLAVPQVATAAPHLCIAKDKDGKTFTGHARGAINSLAKKRAKRRAIKACTLVGGIHAGCRIVRCHKV